MLRITPRDDGTEYLISLEGCVCGPWVTELGTCWIAAATTEPGRRIRVELADVAHVDEAGRELLTLMYRAGVRLASKGFVMADVVRQISESVDREARS